MSTRLLQDGIEIRRFGLGAKRHIRFDEIDRIEGSTAIVGKERFSLPAQLARDIEPILRGPSLDGVGIAQYLSGPHGPRIAARALLAATEKLAATDLHLERLSDGGLVRLRLEGELVELCRIPLAASSPLVAALKGLAGCLPYRSDLVQEGRIAREGVGADIRASFVPTALGERVALRFFGRLRRLPELGFGAETLSALERVLASRTGLLLIAGSNGAGKTTTLYAALAHLCATRAGAHLSLEDPVEQRLRVAGIPVDQVELEPARGITGESMLAAALRQDIDVICVGEVRSEGEAQLALKAAHTGRLVLAGVHAGSCEEAQQRMLDLGADAKLLAQSLRGVLHQELAVEACGCTDTSACTRCRGLGRRRSLRARLITMVPRLEAVA